MDKNFKLEIEYVNCLLCKNDSYEILTNYSIYDTTLNIVRCKCGFIYLNPRPSIDSISFFYNDEYIPHKSNNISFPLNWFKKLTFTWKENIINKLFYNPATMLDVGSGDGSFSKYMSESGWKAKSYDKFAPGFNNKGHKNRKFDLITMWHSLEHFHDSDAVIKEVHNLLKNNSYLLIALPNYNSIDRKIFQDKWIAFDVPRHLYHYTSDTIKKYLDYHNIRIVSSKVMYQDTFFNIYLSLKNNILYKTLFFPFITIFALFLIFFNKDKASSILYICQKK